MLVVVCSPYRSLQRHNGISLKQSQELHDFLFENHSSATMEGLMLHNLRDVQLSEGKLLY